MGNDVDVGSIENPTLLYSFNGIVYDVLFSAFIKQVEAGKKPLHCSFVCF